jgi:hypothetical protein
VQGDPAGVAPHQLHDEYPVVALRRRVDLSSASVAVLTAVSNPNVDSVPATSLSIVFGTPTTGMPFQTAAGNSQAAVAADRHERIEPVGPERGDQLVGTILLVDGAVGQKPGPLERIAIVGGAENGAAQVRDAPHLPRPQQNQPRLRLRPRPGAPVDCPCGIGPRARTSRHIPG